MFTKMSYAEAARTEWIYRDALTEYPFGKKVVSPTLEEGAIYSRPIGPLPKWHFRPNHVKPRSYELPQYRQYYEHHVLSDTIAHKTSIVDARFLLYLKKKNKYNTNLIKQKFFNTKIFKKIKYEKFINTDIKTHPAQPTSRKQVKIKTNKVLIEQGGATQAPPFICAPTRNPLYLRVLKQKILNLKLKRIRTSTRMHNYLKFVYFCSKNPLCAEGQGLFSVGMDDGTKDFLSDMANKMTTNISSAFSKVGDSLKNSLTCVGALLLTAAAGNTKASWLTGALSSLVTVGIINWTTMKNVVTAWGAETVTQPASSSGLKAQAQAPSWKDVQEASVDSSVITGMTLLTQAVGTYCGIKRDLNYPKKELNSWAGILSKNLQDNARGSSGLTGFFSNFVYFVKSIVKRAMRVADPSYNSMIAFWEHSTVLKEIIDESNLLIALPEESYAEVENVARLDAMIILVTEIIVRMGAVDTQASTMGMINFFSQLKTKLLSIKAVCNKKGQSSIVSVTPYAVYFYGESGIGKSRVLNALANPVLEAMEGNVTSNSIFTMKPAAKHWDGYNKQQVVVFDDFQQVTAVGDYSDAKELFQLVTDQPYRPPMADVESKGIIADIKVILMASNDGWPKPSDIAHPEALWRRRNKMFKVVVNTSKPTPNKEHDPTFAHLKFKEIANPKDPVEPSPKGPYLSFEKVKDILVADAKAHLEAEKSKVAHRIKEYQDLSMRAPRSSRNPISLANLEKKLIAEMTKRTVEITPVDTTYAAAWKKIKSNRVSHWMKTTFPWLYKPPSEEEIKKVEAELDEKLSDLIDVAEHKNMKIDETNYMNYLNDTYHSLTPEQQLTVQNEFEKYNDTTWMVPPKKKEGGVSAQAQAPEPTSVEPENASKEPPVAVGTKYAGQKEADNLYANFYMCDRYKDHRVTKGKDKVLSLIATNDTPPFPRECKCQQVKFVVDPKDEESVEAVVRWEACMDMMIDNGYQKYKGSTVGCLKCGYYTPSLGMSSIEYKRFPEKVYPFAYSLVQDWILDDRQLPISSILKCVKWIEFCVKSKWVTVPCKHSYLDPNQSCVNAPSSYIQRGCLPCGTNAPKMMCEDACILSSTEFLRTVQILKPKFYNDLTAYSKVALPEQAHRVVHPLDCSWKRFKNKMNNAWRALKPIVNFTLSFAWTILKWLLYIITPILLILTAIFGYRGWKSLKQQEPETSTFKRIIATPHTISDQFKHAWTNRTYASAYEDMDPCGVEGEGQGYTHQLRPTGGTQLPHHKVAPLQAMCETHKDSMRAIYKKSTCFIELTGAERSTGEMKISVLRIFNTHDNFFLMPRHYQTLMATLDPDTVKCILHIDGIVPYEFNFKSTRFWTVGDSELMIYHIPCVARGRDIRKHFVSFSQWERAPLPSNLNIFEKLTDAVYIHRVKARMVSDLSVCVKDDPMCTIPSVIGYDWEGAGRCMSLIFDDSYKIRGFHIAGGNDTGYGQWISADTLLDFNHTYEPPVVDIIDPEKDSTFVAIDTSLVPIGVAQAQWAVHVPTETNIRPSLMHDPDDIRMKPAPLKPCAANNYVNPLDAGVRKHGLPPTGFDSDKMDVAELRFTELLLANVKPVWCDVTVRPLHLALDGVSGVPGFRPIVLNTSEGFPYCNLRENNKASKHWLIHRHEVAPSLHEYSIHPTLMDQYNKNMELRRQGIIPPTVFMDCLKDARLPLIKADTPGKVRIFSVAPTDFVLAFRQYFADFIAAFTNARFKMHHAIGIAPEKYDWTELTHHLFEVGNKFLCGDYSNFGPAFDHGVHKLVYRSILKWYEFYNTNPNKSEFFEDQKIREIIQIELSEPIHIAKDLVYTTVCGMCSGSPSTTPDNCCVNIVYILLAWLTIFEKEPTRCTFDYMLKNLRFVVYGDDIIMCVSDEVVDIFNNVSLSEFFAKHNIKYTDADKSNRIRPYCTIDEAQFLKRKFVKHPTKPRRWLGAIDKDSVVDCAYWIHKTIDPVAASIEACYASLQLAYGWGPEYYNSLRTKYLKFWLAKGESFTPRTWYDYDYIYSSKTQEERMITYAEAQAPPTSTPGETTVCEESKDTVIQEHVEPDSVCPPKIQQHIIDYAGADYDASYERLLNRYILFDQFNWSASDAKNSMLKVTNGQSTRYSKWVLPLAAIKAGVNSPTILPFLQHRYVNFDMDVRIVVNANKFMVGQLQASWYYGHDSDGAYNLRESIYARSQMLHSIVDAGSSNSIQMCIPYKSYRPWINVKKDDHLGAGSSLGELRLMVLSPLQVTSTTSKEAHVSIYIKFRNGNFMGVVPRDLNKVAEGQMFPMLTTMAATYLMQKMSDENRDKPPVQLPPIHMQPMGSTALGIGTGCSEPLVAMRLDARGQVPHPDRVDTSMYLGFIASQKGLINSFTWHINDTQDKTLWTMPVTPCISRENMNKVLLKQGNASRKDINAYNVPPVAVVAGLMTSWRGSLQFQFVVVGSQYHTGRLLCCFVPTQDESITMQQAQAVPYVVFDIHDERTFTYETPYIADKPWWPCGYTNGQKVEPPAIGHLFIKVLNPLIPMDSVAKDLEVLVYVSGAPSLEFAIPRQPVWALPWNIDVVAPETIYADEGYYPWYISSWREVHGGDVCVVRYGNVTDHVAQFTGLRFGQIGASGGWFYYYLSPDDANYPDNKKITYKGRALSEYVFIPINTGDGYGHIYLGALLKSNLGIGAGKIFTKNFEVGLEPDYSRLEPVQGETIYLKGNPGLREKLFENIHTASLRAESQGPELNVCTTNPTVISTGYGAHLFGESYLDGKDYLRRYEQKFKVSYTINSNKSTKFLIAFNPLPAGFDIPYNDEYSHSARDGGHALVASGYRFYRGSLNYKIVNTNSATTMWVEHRPDREFRTFSITRKGESDLDSTWFKNYAQAVAIGSVNRVITVNIPFYQNGMLGLLQRPKIDAPSNVRKAYCLGEVMIGIDVDTQLSNTDDNPITGRLDILGSIGDDMRFYTYTGFPPLVYISELLATNK